METYRVFAVHDIESDPCWGCLGLAYETNLTLLTSHHTLPTPSRITPYLHPPCVTPDFSPIPQSTIRHWQDGDILNFNVAEGGHPAEGGADTGALPDQRTGCTNSEGNKTQWNGMEESQMLGTYSQHLPSPPHTHTHTLSLSSRWC